MRVVAGVIALAVGLLVATEWHSRRVWRRCGGSQAVPAQALREAVERELVLLRPRCELTIERLTCRWRTPLNSWRCCARVDAGVTDGDCGSG